MNLLEFDRQWSAPILGIDEVGTGALAGPIAVAGVVLPVERDVLNSLLAAGMRDSKKLKEDARYYYLETLKQQFIWYHCEFIYPDEIEEFGQSYALHRGYDKVAAAAAAGPGYRHLLLDGNPVKSRYFGRDHVAIVKGDDKSMSIACGSIVAKAMRDIYMVEQHCVYPQYGFHKHKGYPTKEHGKAIKTHGATPLHRMTTKGVRRALGAYISS